jgi:hypothetical protein
MSADKTIIRTRKNRENPYVMIDKTGINDERLSLKAKGLLATLLSKPDDWKVYITQLAKTCKDGVDSVKSALKELREYGYVTMERIRDEKGRITQTEWIVYEQPIYDEKIELKTRREKKKKDSKRPITSRVESISGFSTNGETTDGKSHTTNKRTSLKNDSTNKLNNNKRQQNKHKVSSTPKEKDSVVVDPSPLEELLQAKKLEVNAKTLSKWRSLDTEENIILAIEEALQRPGVKNLVGYITRTLENGYSSSQASGSVSKGQLPEWIASQQEVVASASELSEEQKRQAHELLRALGEIK